MKLAVGFILYEEATARYLADFLPSLEEALKCCPSLEAQIYIYDNSALGKEENAQIISAWKHKLEAATVKVMYYRGEGQNLGFSRAYNILISQAALDQAQCFLIINPDTKLEPLAISHLLAALNSDATLGSVAPKILRWRQADDKSGDTIDSLGIELAPGLRFFDQGQGSPVTESSKVNLIIGPSGAAGLFLMSALERVAEHRDKKQYFDERFFMYKEDCDLVYRLSLAGYGSRLVPEAVVFHDRSAASSGWSLAAILRGRRHKSRSVRTWSFVNQHLIYLKHWSKQSLASRLLIIYRIIIYFIFSLILEQYLLKTYPLIWRKHKQLTNI